MMSEYTMPLAETASTFNETMLAQTVLKTADEDLAFSISGRKLDGSHAMRDGYLQPFPV